MGNRIDGDGGKRTGPRYSAKIDYMDVLACWRIRILCLHGMLVELQFVVRVLFLPSKKTPRRHL